MPTPRRNPRSDGSGTFSYIDIDAVDNVRQRIVAPKVLKNQEAPSRARHEIRTGDVIFSLVRPYLKNIAVVPPELDRQVASSAFCILRPGEGLVPEYLFRVVSADSFIASVPTYGHSPPAGRDDELLGMSIPLPPVDEQRRIVEAVERALSRLSEAEESVVRSARGLNAYLASSLETIFNGAVGDARRTPAFAFVTSGSRGWASYYADSGVPFIRMGNLERGQLALNLTPVQRVHLPLQAEGMRTRVEEGDLLISITADLGMIGIVPPDLGEAYVNQHIALARANPEFDPRYLGWYLISPSGQRELTRFRRGATKLGLGLADIRSVTAPLLPNAGQVAIVQEIERRASVTEAMRRELTAASRRAAALHQAILHAALVGAL